MPVDPLFIAAGDLRHSVSIQQPSTVRDEAGQPVATWTTVLVTRAKIESTTSSAYKELIQGDAIASQATDVVTIRWPGSSITLAPGMHVLFGANTYIVQAVVNVLERNRVLKLFCMVIDGSSN